MGRICWLQILKESCVGSSLQTALYTDVLDAMTASVVLSWTSNIQNITMAS